MSAGEAGPSGAEVKQPGGAHRRDVGSAEAGILLAILLVFFVLALIFMATGDGFCFEYC
ncbi:MAG: hypothetical protein ACJ72Y_00285 [Actinomycetes bacterium]